MTATPTMPGMVAKVLLMPVMTEACCGDRSRLFGAKPDQVKPLEAVAPQRRTRATVGELDVAERDEEDGGPEEADELHELAREGDAHPAADPAVGEDAPATLADANMASQGAAERMPTSPAMLLCWTSRK